MSYLGDGSIKVLKENVVSNKYIVLSSLRECFVSDLALSTYGYVASRQDRDEWLMSLVEIAKEEGIKLKLNLLPGSQDYCANPDPSKEILQQLALLGCHRFLLFMMEEMKMTVKDIVMTSFCETNLLRMMSIDMCFLKSIKSENMHNDTLPDSIFGLWNQSNLKCTRMMRVRVVEHLDDTHPFVIGLSNVIEMLIPHVEINVLKEIVEEHKKYGEELVARLIEKYM